MYLIQVTIYLKPTLILLSYSKITIVERIVCIYFLMQNLKISLLIKKNKIPFYLYIKVCLFQLYFSFSFYPHFHVFLSYRLCCHFIILLFMSILFFFKNFLVTYLASVMNTDSVCSFFCKKKLLKFMSCFQLLLFHSLFCTYMTASHNPMY